MTKETRKRLDPRIEDARAVRNELMHIINDLETKVWRKVTEVRNDADRAKIIKVFIKERDNFGSKTLSAISNIIRNA